MLQDHPLRDILRRDGFSQPELKRMIRRRHLIYGSEHSRPKDVVALPLIV